MQYSHYSIILRAMAIRASRLLTNLHNTDSSWILCSVRAPTSTMGYLLLFLWLSAAASVPTVAFAPRNAHGPTGTKSGGAVAPRSRRSRAPPFLHVGAATPTDEEEAVGMIDRPPMPPGSHDELMYALGVNLARQLGDVRPLVEDGAELACVAKGLLDAVVGRLTDEGQVDLLSRRKEELNQVIASRA